MGQYRYRTCVLVGPWRSSRSEAAGDAVRTRQAKPKDGGEGLEWLVPGRIEEAMQSGQNRRGSPVGDAGEVVSFTRFENGNEKGG